MISARLRTLLFLALAPLWAAGCTTVSQTHWIQGPFDNKRPAGVSGFDYSEFSVDPALAGMLRGKTLRVEVADPAKTLDPARSRVLSPMDWKIWRDDCEKTLANRLYQSKVFSDVGQLSDERPIQKPDLVFRIAVVEWDEGNAFLRYFPGFGAGATLVQWEGELTAGEPGAGKRLFAFADVRRHPGGPYFGISARPYHGDRLIAEDLSMAFDELSGNFRALAGVTEEPLSSFIPHPAYRTPASGISAPAPAAASDPLKAPLP